jgi:competence protein ComEC
MQLSTSQQLNLRAAWPLAVLGFIAACTALQFRATLPSAEFIAPWLYGAVAFALFTLVTLARYYVKTISSTFTLALLVLAAASGLALGGTWAATVGAQRVADGWPAALEGKDIVATGYVATMPTLGTSSQQVLFVMEGNEVDPTLNGKTLALSWYYGTFNLQPAQRYRVQFRAKQRHGGMNPQGFDYELWLVARGIAATGYIRATPADLGSQAHYFLPWVERGRSHIRERLFAVAPTLDAARWAAALALGDQRSLNDADWQRYNATGTGHLLAVSGTHITLMGALLAWLAGRWWAAKPQRLLRLPVQRLRLNVMLGTSWAYALLAGWALPAQRTVLMLAVAWWALRFMARPAVWHVMASSAAVALAFDPMAVISPSFWLSYGAVAALIAVEMGVFKSVREDEPTPETLLAEPTAWQERWQNRWQAFKHAARSQLLLTLALIPLGAVFFNQISVVSPLANAVAIPVMGWVSTPLALLAAALALVWGGMAAALMQALLAVQHGMDWGLDVLLQLPYAQLFVPTAPLGWAVFGMVCAVGSVFLSRVWRWTAAGGVVAYVVGAFFIAAQPQLGWRVVFLDVGQGMAVAVHSQGRTLLFDAGPRYSADSDGAARVIVPYLHAVGVTQLDYVILSHADDDHTGGARSLLARMPVGQWWHSLSPVHPLLAVLPPSKLPCEAGKTLAWAGLTLQWLHPPAGIDHDDHKTNAVACVLRVTDGRRSVLLTADIEAAQEAELVAKYGSALASQVLLAPHHGSKTSSTEAFLRAVNPQHVVMQNGYRNRYGHPHPTVSQRYIDLGLTQWRSDVDGAVILDVQPDGLRLQSWRAQAQRYWHTIMPAASTLRAVADGIEF